MEGPAGDSQQSNPDLPAAGWYADPSGDGGIRWWTGSEWAQRVSSPAHQQTASAQARSIKPASVALAESMRACRRVASELFALITILLVPAFLALAGAAWYALREAAVVVSVNPDTGELAFEETRGGAEASEAAILVLLALGLVWIGGSILAMASSIQAVQSNANRPATWLQSLTPLARRPKPVTLAISAFVLFSAFMGYVWFSGQLPAILLMIPSLFLALIVWTRYAFVAAASALGPESPSAFKQSSSAVSGHFFDVLGRNLFLGAWTVLSSIGFLFLTRLLTSGAAEDPSLPGTRDRFVFSFSGSFGDNVYLWMLLAVFSSIFWGAMISVWSGANALMFAELKGDVAVENYPLREEESD